MWGVKNSFYNKTIKKHQFIHSKHTCPFFCSIILGFRKCKYVKKDRQNRTIICTIPKSSCKGKSTGWSTYNSFYNYYETEDIKLFWGL